MRFPLIRSLLSSSSSKYWTHTPCRRLQHRRNFSSSPRARWTARVQAREDDDVALAFPEEPLGLPADSGFGFFQGGVGDVLGPDGRYEVKQKLGYGTTSSVWLAKDNVLNQFVALKVLSGTVSALNVDHRLRELDVYKALGKLTAEHNCSTLVDHFYHTGTDEADGSHLCLVLDLLRCSVLDIGRTLYDEGKTLPTPVVKLILKDILKAVSYLHKNGVAHIGITPESIRVPVDYTLDIQRWLAQNPAKTYDPIPSARYEVMPWVSRPLPLPPMDKLEEQWFVLSQFTRAQFIGSKTLDEWSSPLFIHPPEVILGGDWDQSADIWSIGVLVFYLLTQRLLFMTNPPPELIDILWPVTTRPLEVQQAYEAGEDLPESSDFILYQMSWFTNQPFPPELLWACPLTSEYFDTGTNMLKKMKVTLNNGVRIPMFDILLDHFRLAPIANRERKGGLAFMARCMKLLPSERPTAEELLEDPWLQDDGDGGDN
ncbi:hypothetical protein AX16_005142 [Volvariella volvacea WC 439]|nr:hypothetical protein AX16_005142 [Volvariella volvacea WC 439]